MARLELATCSKRALPILWPWSLCGSETRARRAYTAPNNFNMGPAALVEPAPGRIECFGATPNAGAAKRLSALLPDDYYRHCFSTGGDQTVPRNRLSQLYPQLRCA